MSLARSSFSPDIDGPLVRYLGPAPTFRPCCLHMWRDAVSECKTRPSHHRAQAEFHLSEAGAAQLQMHAGDFFGKILLRP